MDKLYCDAFYPDYRIKVQIEVGSRAGNESRSGALSTFCALAVFIALHEKCTFLEKGFATAVVFCILFLFATFIQARWQGRQFFRLWRHYSRAVAFIDSAGNKLNFDIERFREHLAWYREHRDNLVQAKLDHVVDLFEIQRAEADINAKKVWIDQEETHIRGLRADLEERRGAVISMQNQLAVLADDWYVWRMDCAKNDVPFAVNEKLQARISTLAESFRSFWRQTRRLTQRVRVPVS